MTALVTYLGEECELLGMTRVPHGRLFFALRAPDGTIIGATGRQLDEALSQRDAPDCVSLRIAPAGSPPVPVGAPNSNYGDV